MTNKKLAWKITLIASAVALILCLIPLGWGVFMMVGTNFGPQSSDEGQPGGLNGLIFAIGLVVAAVSAFGVTLFSVLFLVARAKFKKLKAAADTTQAINYFRPEPSKTTATPEA